MSYDIIGDIHGNVEKLEALLHKLGYRNRGVWEHSTRKAIFVGDFIDRGPKGVETVEIVRAMVENDCALAIMGNHEFNAIAWHTQDVNNPGEFLRPRKSQPHGSHNRKQHQAYLTQVEKDIDLHKRKVEWFLTLPLWLDLPDIRVVHACWHAPWMAWLSTHLHDGRFLTPELMVKATREPATKQDKDSPEPSVFKAVEALLKGIEVPLPAPITFLDADGKERDRVRARWWDADARTLRQIAHMKEEDLPRLPDMEITEHTLPKLLTDKPVFFGHYWMKGTLALASPSAACVDYSAGSGGPLVAYRWDGEAKLSAHNFVSAQAPQ